jgi:DNA-binding transcriptional regulator YdaS (Cro superfamily)
MTKEEYEAARRKVGSQVLVAQALGVGKSTISKRESGLIPISPEMALAIERLVELRERGELGAGDRGDRIDARNG